MSRRTLAIAGGVRRRPRSAARGESLMDVTDKKNAAAQAPEGDEGIQYDTIVEVPLPTQALHSPSTVGKKARKEAAEARHTSEQSCHRKYSLL